MNRVFCTIYYEPTVPESVVKTRESLPPGMRLAFWRLRMVSPTKKTLTGNAAELVCDGDGVVVEHAGRCHPPRRSVVSEDDKLH